MHHKTSLCFVDEFRTFPSLSCMTCHCLLIFWCVNLGMVAGMQNERGRPSSFPDSKVDRQMSTSEAVHVITYTMQGLTGGSEKQDTDRRTVAMQTQDSSYFTFRRELFQVSIFASHYN